MWEDVSIGGRGASLDFYGKDGVLVAGDMRVVLIKSSCLPPCSLPPGFLLSNCCS